jgi:CheY-like chemotaxis protein
MSTRNLNQPCALAKIGTKMEIILPCKHHTIEPFHGDDPNICEHDSISNTAESYKKDNIRSKFRMNKRDIILIVDDDDLILRFLSKMLQKWKYEHRTCSNGIDASRLYETLHSRISLIIMDIQMPIDGITTTKAIRRFETKMNIPFKVPIVANTASGSTDSLRKTCTEAGMCGFTQKPNHKTDIKQIIERYATFH